MVGNRVRIVIAGSPNTLLEGVLHSLTAEGAIIWPTGGMPEQSGNRFIPMHRINEIIDLGRMP